MLNQVAVLSDIHGYLPVLEAILDEPDVDAADRIVITGDHVAGPQPVEVLQRLAELPEQVQTVVCGHTHMPFVRLVDRRTVINPGSVGMPYGNVGGAWALLRDGHVSLRRTVTDPATVINRVVTESSFPGVTDWAQDYLTGTISDLDALAAMRPRTL